MLENLISSVLNQLLGNFIENIDKGQLGTSILSGSLLLTNMRLKSTIFDDSPLPFSLQYGHVGKIYLKIPIWDMFKSPLVIEIEDVFGFVSLKPVSQWDEQQQIAAFQNGNQNFLEQFEIFMKQKALLLETQKESACGFKEKLLARILDNLKISIKRVYFRFEDYILVKNTPYQKDYQEFQKEKFCIGIKLKEFFVSTTNKDYDQIVVTNSDKKSIQADENIDEQKLTFKIVKIQGLSLFCDWENIDDPENGGIDLQKLNVENFKKQQNKLNEQSQYFYEIQKNEFNEDSPDYRKSRKNFINNFEAELRLQFNKDIANPLAPASLKFPQLFAFLIIGSQESANQQQQVQIFQPQILRILKTIEMIGFFNEFREGALQDIIKRQLTNDEKIQYLEAYYQFKKIELKLEGKFTESNIYKVTYQKLQTDFRKQMKSIEDLVDSMQIVELRQQSYEKAINEDGRAKELEKIEEEIQKEINNKIGYGFFSSKAQKSKIQVEIRQMYEERINEIKLQYDNKDSLISENIKALINEFRDQEQQDEKQAREVLDFDDLAQDYIFLSVKILIPKNQTSLINEFSQKLFQMNVLDLQLDFNMAKKFRKLNIQLNEFNIQDFWTNSVIWPLFAQTKQIQDTDYSLGNKSNSDLALQIEFEQNKDFKTCPFDLKITAQKSCFIVLNVPLINEIIRTMNKALQNEKLDFEYFMQLALSRVNELRSKAKELAENIKKGEFQHQNVQISASIFAPVLIIPDDVFEKNSRYLKIDLGQINIASDLQIYKQQKNYKLVKNEDEIYDLYKFGLTKLSFQLIDFYEQAEHKNQIIKDVSFLIKIMNSLDPLHPEFPSLQIHFSFDDPIKIEIAEGFQLLKILLEIKEKLLVQFLNKDYHLVAFTMNQEYQSVNQNAQIINQIQQNVNQPIQELENQENAIQQFRRQATKKKNQFVKDQPNQQYKQDIQDNLEKAGNNEIVDIKNENNGSNIHMKIKMNSLLIQFGTEGAPSKDEILSGIIDK